MRGTDVKLDQLPSAPLAPILVVFPLAVSIRQDNRVTAAILVILFLVSVAHKYRSAERVNLLPIGLLMVSVALVFWRGPFMIAGLFILAVLVLVTAAWATPRASAYASLLAGLCLYLFANILGWLIGVKSPSSSVRIGEYKSSDNIFSSRIFFPFAQGINEPAWVATALICAVAAIISIRQKPHWYLWAGSVAGVVVILGCNSRTPILVAVPTIAFLLIAPRMTRRLAPYAVSVVMLLPFFIVQAQSVLRWAAELVASSSYLARGNNIEEIVGLSSRDAIWTHSIDYWGVHVTETTQQLFGFGFLGHASSGAAASYNSGVSYLTDRNALTMHNSVLQTVFDAGLVGAVILLGLVFFTVRRYGRDQALLPMLAVAMMVGLSGALEVTLAPGLGQTPIFLLLYLLVFVPVRVISPLSRAKADPTLRGRNGLRRRNSLQTRHKRAAAQVDA